MSFVPPQVPDDQQEREARLYQIATGLLVQVRVARYQRMTGEQDPSVALHAVLDADPALKRAYTGGR